jgi:hypothetical protein
LTLMVRDAVDLLPAASAALTERTTVALPRFIALRSLASAVLDSLTRILAVLAEAARALCAAQNDLLPAHPDLRDDRERAALVAAG